MRGPSRKRGWGGPPWSGGCTGIPDWWVGAGVRAELGAARRRGAWPGRRGRKGAWPGRRGRGQLPGQGAGAGGSPEL